MGSSKKVTVGYWYHPVMQLVLGRGPVDAILRVRGADVDAWTGEITASGTIAIDNPELWGGESSEGGIVGDLEVSMGDAAQTPNAYADAQLGADPSAHRGQLSMLFKGGRFGAMNPYPKALSVMLRRILEGWELAGGSCWYPEKAPIPVAVSEPTVIANTAAGWSYQVVAGVINTTTDLLIDALTLPSAGYASGQMPFGHDPTVAAFEPPLPINTPWLPETSLWLRRTISVPAGHVVTLAGNIENAVIFWINGVRFGDVNRHNAQITSLPAFSITIPAELLLPGNNVLTMLCLDEDDVPDPSPSALLQNDATYFHCSISIGARDLLAINPAHALYYSLVSETMQGEPVGFVNEASFIAAADIFFAEGLGVCTEWDPDKETVEQFRARICEAVGARMSRSTVDGQWYLDVMRGVANPSGLPVLSDDDILDFELEPAVLDDAVNQVSIQWFDPLTKQERTTAPLQALGAIDAGGVVAQTLSYTCLPTEGLALRAGERELRQRATPLKRFRLVANRRPYSWRTGNYFRLQAPKRGIADMVCLVGDIEKGTLRSGAISLTAVEDVFGMPATSYVTGQEPIPPASTAPVVVTEQRAFEAPYVELVQSMGAGDLAALAADAGYLAVVGARPGVGINYELNTRPAAGTYAAIGNFDWCPTAVVVQAAARLDTSFSLASASLLGRVDVGTAALWGDEIVRVDAIDGGALTITLARGCADTVPQAHAAGERIWFFDAWAGSDLVEYVDGETAEAKLRTRTGTDILSLDFALAISATFDSRAHRPYPPGRMRINGLAAPANVETPGIEVTGAHRDRVLQADQLVDTEAASVGPEVGTTYGARLVRTDTEAQLDSQTGLSSPSATLAAEYVGEVRVELWSMRDGLESWQRQAMVFLYIGDGRATEAGELRETEAGEIREQE